MLFKSNKDKGRLQLMKSSKKIKRKNRKIQTKNKLKKKIKDKLKVLRPGKASKRID